MRNLGRVPVALSALVAVALATGCSSDDSPPTRTDGGGTGADVEALRGAGAGACASTCPLDLDVPAALAAAGVEPGSVTLAAAAAEVSATEEPAPDALAAQRSGTSVLDSTAGAYAECTYDVGGRDLSVRTYVSRSTSPTAALAFMPALQYADGATAARDAAEQLGDDGVLVVDATTAIADVPTAGEAGDAAVLVFGSAVEGLAEDGLRRVASEIAAHLSA